MANRNLFLGFKAIQASANVGAIADQAVSIDGNATYTDSVVTLAAGTANFVAIDFCSDTGAADSAGAGETLELRWDQRWNGVNSNVVSYFVFHNATDQQLLRLTWVNATLMSLQYNSGTLAVPAWTNVTGTPTWAGLNSLLHTYNFKVHINSGGVGNHTVEFYVDNVLTMSGSFTMALLTTINGCMWGGSVSTNVPRISQVYAAVGTNLIGSFVHNIKADGAGSNSAMTGAFTDVNEVVGTDTTTVSSATAGQRTTFSMANLPALPGGTIIGGFSRHTFSARASAVAPSNLKPVIRQGGVDTVGANLTGMTVGYSLFTVGYNLTAAQINTAGFELGWESAT